MLIISISFQIINEMKKNEALAVYEAEYTRLFESLYKTHRNEDELIEKCRLLEVKLFIKLLPYNIKKRITYICSEIIYAWFTKKFINCRCVFCFLS